MGWKGTLRAIAAAQRRSERESIRRQHELARRQKQAARLHELEMAEIEVAEYENYVERITSVHRECGDSWNWAAIAKRPAPVRPDPTSRCEAVARNKLERYVPGWFDKVLGRIEKKKSRLAHDVELGKQADSAENERSRVQYESDLKDWAEMQDLADRMVAHNPAAYKEAFEELNPLGELIGLGTRVIVTFGDDGSSAEAVLHVNGEDLVPPETKSLLKSGKLSTKKCAPSRFYEIYQDYVCGAVLRVGRELFALLPIETIVITAVSNMLDTSSGHMKDQAILSVLMPRETVEKLNFEAVDPSDSLRNFVHRVDFKKSKGFSSVEALSVESMLVGEGGANG